MSRNQRSLARDRGVAPRVGRPITIDPADWAYPPSAKRTIQVTWHPNAINRALQHWLAVRDDPSEIRTSGMTEAINIAIDALRTCGGEVPDV